MTHATFITEQEFLAAYDEHADAVFRHCYLRTLDREKSKEVLCEAFQRLWLFIADGNYVDSMKKFLFRATNALITASKADATRIGAEQPAEAAMAATLQKLPAEHRPSFLLHSVEGFSAEDIQEILGGKAEHHATMIAQSASLLSTHA